MDTYNAFLPTSMEMGVPQNPQYVTPDAALGHSVGIVIKVLA